MIKIQEDFNYPKIFSDIFVKTFVNDFYKMIFDKFNDLTKDELKDIFKFNISKKRVTSSEYLISFYINSKSKYLEKFEDILSRYYISNYHDRNYMKIKKMTLSSTDHYNYVTYTMDTNNVNEESLSLHISVEFEDYNHYEPIHLKNFGFRIAKNSNNEFTYQNIAETHTRFN